MAHEGVREYKCKICLKKFAELGDLRRHFTTVHEKSDTLVNII